MTLFFFPYISPPLYFSTFEWLFQSIDTHFQDRHDRSQRTDFLAPPQIHHVHFPKMKMFQVHPRCFATNSDRHCLHCTVIWYTFAFQCTTRFRGSRTNRRCGSLLWQSRSFQRSESLLRWSRSFMKVWESSLMKQEFLKVWKPLASHIFPRRGQRSRYI